MAADDQDLEEAIGAYTRDVFPSSKAQVIEHYKDQYGVKAWKGKLASEIAGTSDAKSLKYKSAMRNFQGKRLEQEGKTKKWEEIGKTLSPLHKELTKEKITIEVKGTQTRGGYRGSTRQRTYTIELVGTNAYEFINGEISLKRLGDDFYGFDFTDDSGDPSSGGTEIDSVEVY